MNDIKLIAQADNPGKPQTWRKCEGTPLFRRHLGFPHYDYYVNERLTPNVEFYLNDTGEAPDPCDLLRMPR